MFIRFFKKKNYVMQITQRIYTSTYPGLTFAYKMCNCKVFLCDDIFDDCILIINKYISSSKNSIIYDICDTDIDLLLFYIYVIINCNYCNNKIHNHISNKQTLLVYDKYNKKFRTDVLIALELNKYLIRDYIAINEPLKLNRKMMSYTIRSCNTKFMSLEE